jgi:hypothetical protein
MGTNFYAGGIHIGKRSAAGFYCWDCGVTLCKGGEAKVHYDVGFYDRCPKCGKAPKRETLSEGAVGRELGFNKSKPAPKTGVQSCASFSWAISPETWRTIIGRKRIKDEYGRWLCRADFEAVLSECPIQYSDLVGQDFS